MSNRTKIFKNHLEPYLAGILAHSHRPLGMNLVQTINHKSRIIKRIARGYRVDASFLLNILAAFPGVG